MATYATLTINAADIIGADFDRSRCSAYIETNTPHGLVIVDGANIRLGGRRENPDATGTITFPNLVATNSADNPTSFAYKVTIVYVPKGSRKQGHDSITTSEFELTATADLASISAAWDNIAIPPNWQSDFMDQAQALLDQQESLAAIDDTDAAVKYAMEFGAQTPSHLAATIANGPFLRGNSGERYGVVACVIRQDSQGSGWYLIEPTPGNIASNHVPINVTGVTTFNGNIVLQYGGMGALGVGSLVVCPDESFAARGYTCGASVAKDAATIMVYRDKPMSDRIYWDGTQWLSADGVFSPSWDGATGIITLNHGANPVPTSQRNSVQLTPRGLSRDVVVSAASSATAEGYIKVSLVDRAAGTVVTAPTTADNFFVTHGQRQEKIDAADVFDPGGNFWCLGVFPLSEEHPEA